MDPDVKNLHRLQKKAAVKRLHTDITRSLEVYKIIANASYGKTDLGVSAYPAELLPERTTPLERFLYRGHQWMRQTFGG